MTFWDFCTFCVTLWLARKWVPNILKWIMEERQGTTRDGGR